MSPPVDRKSLLKFLAGVSGQGRMLVIPRLFVDATGSLEAALLLSQALFWFDSGQADSDGYVRKADNEVEAETGVVRRTIQRVMPQLSRFGLKRVIRGVPATSWYTFDTDTFLEAMAGAESPVAPNPKTSCTESENQLHQTVQLDAPHGATSLYKTVQLISTNRDLKEEGGEVVLPKVTRPAEPPQRIEISTTTDQLPEATLGWGQVVPTPANPYPQDSHRQGLEAEQRIQAAAPRLGARLVELRRISGRTEHNYRLWLRDFVAPHIERLGPAFAMSLEAALKQGVLANPQYALRDVVKSLEAATPPARQAQPAAKSQLSEQEYLAELMARVATYEEVDHGQN